MPQLIFSRRFPLALLSYQLLSIFAAYTNAQSPTTVPSIPVTGSDVSNGGPSSPALSPGILAIIVVLGLIVVFLLGVGVRHHVNRRRRQAETPNQGTMHQQEEVEMQARYEYYGTRAALESRTGRVMQIDEADNSIALPGKLYG
jgi:hypothetical protein